MLYRRINWCGFNVIIGSIIGNNIVVVVVGGCIELTKKIIILTKYFIT